MAGEEFPEGRLQEASQAGFDLLVAKVGVEGGFEVVGDGNTGSLHGFRMHHLVHLVQLVQLCLDI